MKILFILCVASLALGCAKEKVTPTPLPEYHGVAKRAKSVAESVSQAKFDGKTIRALHYESLSLLERIDYKATLLLEGW